MAVIHISEADAARDFARVMAQVRAGAEVVIENGAEPAAILRAAMPTERTVSACIALAQKREEGTGEAPVMSADFAEDIAEVIRSRKPWNPPAWE